MPAKESRRTRPLGLALVLVGVGLIGTSLVPDPGPWAHVAGCAGCSYDAFSGPPGFVILPVAVIVLATTVLSWTAGARWPGIWRVLFFGGLTVLVVGAGTLILLQSIFGTATPSFPEGGGGFLRPAGGSSIEASYGPWLAVAGGLLVMLGAVFVRQSPVDVVDGASAPRQVEEDLVGWSPAVMIGGALAGAGGVVGALSMAAVSGAQTGALAVPFLVVAVSIGLSHSPLIWRPAAALALVATLLFLATTVALGYEDGFLRFGAGIAAMGSGLALLAPISRLRSGSGAPFGADASTRVLIGTGVVMATIAAIVAVGILSGQTF